MSHDDARTPPLIVQDAELPTTALAAFIGQELEQWGFRVSQLRGRDDNTILVSTPDGTILEVQVWR